MKKKLLLAVLSTTAILSADPYSGYSNHPNYYLSDNASTNQMRSTSDQEIAKNVSDALSSGWLSKGFEKVSFDVNNGVVVLSGSVGSIDDKSKIEDQIKKIKGVRQVNNQITVNGEKASDKETKKIIEVEKKYPEDYAATDEDKQINVKIREKLSGIFSDSNKDVKVHTSDGVVTLTGWVNSTSDIDKINKDLKEIDGVKSINNLLRAKTKK